MPSGSRVVTDDWFYEDQVAQTLASHLRKEGWSIGPVLSAKLKERGVDITADRDGQSLLVEVKGYPSQYYRDEARRDEVKRTNPVNQAQHWFSDALLKVMRLQARAPKALVAMAFPDFHRYRSLYDEVGASLATLRITVFFVDESGIVSIREPSPLSSDSEAPESSNMVSRKYGDLAAFFERCEETEIELRFAALDQMTGGLPASARDHRAWWGNHLGNPQAVWMRAGYKVVEVKVSTGYVRFARQA